MPTENEQDQAPAEVSTEADQGMGLVGEMLVGEPEPAPFTVGVSVVDGVAPVSGE